jgi:membrane protein implicated in regulation of membrane protease activity
LDLSDITKSISSFATGHPVVAVIIGIIMLIILFRKPKLFFGLLGLGILVAFIWYMIMSMASSGLSQKDKLLHKEEKQLENLR